MIQCQNNKFFCLLTILFFLGACTTAWAQEEDPCVVAGYELSLNVNHVSCAGNADGSVTVASTGCNCVVSGCTFLWNEGTNYHTASELLAGTYSVTITHPNGCILDTTVVINEPSSFVEAVAATDVSCSGAEDGGAVVIPTDLAGPLTYSWSNGNETAELENVPAGDYSVTVTNFIECTYVASVTIDAAESINLTVLTDAACKNGNNGGAAASVSGGAPPYNFLWNDENGEIATTESVANLAAGSYNLLVVDANNCSETSVVVIEEITEADLSVSVSPTCNSGAVGSATVSVLGGLAPYAYLWSDPSNCIEATVNNLSVGVYSVTVTDANSCNYVYDEVVVEENITVPVTIIADAIMVCAGDAVNLEASGGAYFEWLIDNPPTDNTTASVVVNPTETTNYEVIITTAEGCVSMANATIGVYDEPNPSVNTWSSTICLGESTQLIAAEPNGATFIWSPAETLNNPNSNAPIATPTETTTYTVTATNYDGCTATQELTITVDACTGLTTVNEMMVNLYPNPTKSWVKVSVPNNSAAAVELAVFNTTGQVLQQQQYTATGGLFSTQLDISAYAAGLYYVQVRCAEQTSLQKLIVH